MPPELAPSTFSCAPIGRQLTRRLGPYQGYARSDAPERPIFTFQVAERIVEDWKALPPPSQSGSKMRYDAHYNSNDKAFRFYDPEADAWHQWEGEKAGVATLYPIGEGAWQWECRS